MDLIQRSEEFIDQAVAVVGPNVYLQALAIFAGFLILAKIADFAITRVFKAFAGRTRSDFDDRMIEVMHRPIFLTVVLIGLGVATLRLQLPETAEWVALGVVKTVAVLVLAQLVLRLSHVFLEGASRRGDESNVLQARTLPLFDNVAKVAIFGAAVYFLFMAWDFDVTAWLASAGIIGIALGFAAKDTLANLFSGIFILADAPYKLGDFIVLDSGERGRVTEVGLRTTRMLTRDDIEVTIPNAVMANAKIINESGGPYEKERLRVPIGVAYGSDIDHVRGVLEKIAKDEAKVVDDPEPRVRFRQFGDSGLQFELLCWIAEPQFRGQVLDRLNCTIYKRFLQEGIEIPYPKHDVYIKQMPLPEPGAPATRPLGFPID